MNENESAATALGHLEMIMQAALGDYSPSRGELEKRQAAIVAFIRTGQCLADDRDRELTQIVKSALANSQLEVMNG